MPRPAPTVQFRSTAPVLRRPELSIWSATMPTQTHLIDAPASRPLIAASILIVALGLLALGPQVHPRSGSMQGPSTDTATEAVAEWGD